MSHRLIAAGLLLLSVPFAAQAQDRPVAEQLYDLIAAQQPHPTPGRRINHINGQVFDGSFTASPAAATLSAATVLQGGAVPLVLRFSNTGGDPDRPDNAPGSAIRGFAMSFMPADGAGVDLMTINSPIFATRTPADFVAFNQAVMASGPTAPEPKPVAAWLAAHPETRAFVAFPKPMPASYATEEYWAIHAYRFTNAAGAVHFVRFHVVPEAGVVVLTPEQAKDAPPHGLLDDIRTRVAAGPVGFHLIAQVAEPGDVTSDPTVPWPADRPTVDLGRIVVTRAVADNAAAEKSIGFIPNKSVPGWAPSDDPFLAVRAGVYGVAYPRRQ